MDIVDCTVGLGKIIWITNDPVSFETTKGLTGLHGNRILVDNFDGFEEINNHRLSTALSYWYDFEKLPEDFKAKMLLLGFKVEKSTTVKIRLGEVNHASTRL